jgi:hypothetical protein
VSRAVGVAVAEGWDVDLLATAGIAGRRALSTVRA